MRAWMVGTLLAALLVLPAVAQAELLAASLDVPLAYGFGERSLKPKLPRGALLGVSITPSLPLLLFPMSLGVGMEQYTVKGTVTQSLPPDTDFSYRVRMTDAFVEVTFPRITLKAGAGVGKGQFDTVPGTGYFPEGKLKQVFAALGFQFRKAFEAHLGLYLVRGETDIQSTTSKLDLDANMATLGLRVAF